MMPFSTHTHTQDCAADFAWENLTVGLEASFEREITETMLCDFSKISGDCNPLHVDREYAQAKGYKNQVVFGMLTSSLYSCLAGMHLPGKRCLLHAVHADFLHPVFVGDVLRVSGTIVEKVEGVRQLTIKAIIRNQEGKKVSRAKIEAGVL